MRINNNLGRKDTGCGLWLWPPEDLSMNHTKVTLSESGF
jgi:hypothetical protein